ncbi:MAG: hypothetical protein ACYCUG_02635 [Acidimicrobiales bacterium]
MGHHRVDPSPLPAGIAPRRARRDLRLRRPRLYAALAFEIEEQRRRTVLPTGRRGAGRRAVDSDLAHQVEKVANEGGARRNL